MRNVSIILLGRLTIAFLAVFTNRLLIGNLDPNNLSIIFTFNIYISFALILFSNPFGSLLNNKILISTEEEFKSMLSNFLYLSLIFNLFIAILMAAYLKFFILSEIKYIISVFVTYIILITSISSFYLGIFNIKNRIFFFVLLGVSQNIMIYILYKLFLNEFPSYLTWVVITFLTSLLMTIFQIKILIGRPVKFTLSSVNLLLNKKVINFCVPLIITLTISWIINSYYKLIISTNYSNEVFVNYMIGINIGAAILANVDTVANQYLYPKFLSGAINNAIKSFILYITTYSVVIIFASFFIYVFRSDIIYLFSGILNDEIILGFVICILIEFLRSIYSAFNIYFQYINNNVAYTFISIIIIALLIILNSYFYDGKLSTLAAFMSTIYLLGVCGCIIYIITATHD